MSNFKKKLKKIIAIFFTLLICFFGIFFLFVTMNDIWGIYRAWLLGKMVMVGVFWPGIGIAGIFGCIGLMGIIISLVPNKLPPKILFYSAFFFFVLIIVSPLMDTLLPLSSFDFRALRQESFSCCGIHCPWNTYYDEKYKYSLDFPPGLNVVYENTVELPWNLGGSLTADRGVTFSATDGLLVMTVWVFENSKFHSLDEWLESQKSEYGISVVEKKINIDGNEAIVTHQAEILDGKISEEDRLGKTTVFIKDNNLFIISTEMHDCEKVWNSFKFDK
ncbi:MAG: hypothetical protein V1688_00925 [bacterium]